MWLEVGGGGSAAEVATTDRDGVTAPLLWLRDIRAAWPTPYVFEEPPTLAQGVRVALTTYHQNRTGKAITVQPRLTVVSSLQLSSSARRH